MIVGQNNKWPAGTFLDQKLLQLQDVKDFLKLSKT
jgi:hypothetical protein